MRPTFGSAAPEQNAVEFARIRKAAVNSDQTGQATLPRSLFIGGAVAALGGPLALVALAFPGAAGSSFDSIGLMVALAVLVFAVPLAVWLAYSSRVASVGGLAAFVEEAAGRRAAIVQALIWSVSYFLYLPYTVTYVVYDVLPVVFPGLTAYRTSLELALPVAIFLFVLAPTVVVFSAVTVAAAAQLVLAVVLGAVTFAHTSGHGSSFSPPADAATTGRGVGGIALLFVCLSLPLFFSTEVRGGTRAVTRGLVAAYVAVAVVLVFASAPFATLPGALRDAPLPGVAAAQAFSGRGLAIAVGLGTAASVTILIVLEFLALARLARWLLGTAIRPALTAIAIPFIVADAISLVNPDRFYADLLRPSLIALWISQLIVFAVFPLLARRRPRVLPVATAAAVVACALVGYGLYTAISTSPGS